MPIKCLMLLILDANSQNTKLGIIAHYNKKCLEATMEENVLESWDWVYRWNEMENAKYLSSLKYGGIQIDNSKSFTKQMKVVFSAIFFVSP